MTDLATVYANGKLRVADRFPWLVGEDPLGHSDKEYIDTTIVLDVEQSMLRAEWKEMHSYAVSIHEDGEHYIFIADNMLFLLSCDLVLKEGVAQLVAESFADKCVKTDPAQIGVAIQSLLKEGADNG